MKVHFGTPVQPVTCTTHCGGYWMQEEDGSRSFHPHPHERKRKVKRLFGVSSHGFFIGMMIFDRREQTNAR